MSPRPRSLSVDSRDDREMRGCSPAPGITQCHEPCSSSSPYTMRPPIDRSLAHDDTDDEDLDEDPEIGKLTLLIEESTIEILILKINF